MEAYRNRILYLAAVLMYCAGTFHFVSGHMLPGCIYAAAGACFTSFAVIYSKMEKEDHL